MRAAMQHWCICVMRSKVEPKREVARAPRPRLHLIRFHGVLAPNAGLRARVVRHIPLAQTQATTQCGSRRPGAVRAGRVRTEAARAAPAVTNTSPQAALPAAAGVTLRRMQAPYRLAPAQP